MNLSEELKWRGLIKDKTFEDINWLDEPKTFYLGVDCQSADSMTIGNLAVFMTARRLLDAGWRTILLVGGATSLIGDPGGKEEERQLKSREEIQKNVAGIQAQVKRLFSDKEYIAVDNYDWFENIGYLEFLREVGKHYSMTELLQRDFIARRIGEGGSGISYAEFSYSLIQGYDYWHLFKEHGAVLQIGGSDQWGNMLSGAPLIRKKENAEAHAMSMPLVINKATGKKFGKSEDGAVWLDADKTSVFRFYQFWLNVDDEGVMDYLKIYTLLPKEEIVGLIEEFHANPGSRVAQKRLAYEATKLVHGQERADAVVRVTDTLFGQGDFAEIGQPGVDILRKELPVVRLENGLFAAMVSAGLASSNSEAMRFVQDGAVSINGQKITPDTADPFVAGTNLIKRGKNGFALIDK